MYVDMPTLKVVTVDPNGASSGTDDKRLDRTNTGVSSLKSVTVTETEAVLAPENSVWRKYLPL